MIFLLHVTPSWNHYVIESKSLNYNFVHYLFSLSHSIKFMIILMYLVRIHLTLYMYKFLVYLLKILGPVLLG